MYLAKPRATVSLTVADWAAAAAGGNQVTGLAVDDQVAGAGMSVATTGTPAAIASMTEFDWPSKALGDQSRSKWGKSRGTSLRCPRKWT